MQRIEFYGWQYGYRKVASMKLFEEHFGIGLLDAQQKAHILLEKQSFTLSVESREKANEVIRQFTQIGTLCRLVEPD